MDSGKITLAGFMKLHEMALEDTEGGEEEIRDTLSSMGYNSALQLVKVWGGGARATSLSLNSIVCSVLSFSPLGVSIPHRRVQ